MRFFALPLTQRQPTTNHAPTKTQHPPQKNAQRQAADAVALDMPADQLAAYAASWRLQPFTDEAALEALAAAAARGGGATVSAAHVPAGA